jgi:hypothetical protein
MAQGVALAETGMTRPILFLATLLALTTGGAAHAQTDPVFPPGSRVGLVPPQGFVTGKTFKGFADVEKNAMIIITELPASVYPALEERIAAEQLEKQGITVETREQVALPTGPAFLVAGRQEAGGIAFRRWVLFGSAPDLTAIVSAQVPEAAQATYPEAAIRAALATFAVRAKAPVEEQLGLLPFEVGELAGFRVVRVLPGSAALLTEGPNDGIEVAEQPLVLISVGRGAPGSATNERDRFSRGVLAETPGVKELRLVRSEPLRIGGHPGHEILAEAKDVKTGTDLMVAQWLRFGGNAHLRIVGVARKDQWTPLYPRLRAVRDGIDPR